jgi:hypothetical protein
MAGYFTGIVRPRWFVHRNETPGERGETRRHRDETPGTPDETRKARFRQKKKEIETLERVVETRSPRFRESPSGIRSSSTPLSRHLAASGRLIRPAWGLGLPPQRLIRRGRRLNLPLSGSRREGVASQPPLSRVSCPLPGISSRLRSDRSARPAPPRHRPPRQSPPLPGKRASLPPACRSTARRRG